MKVETERLELIPCTPESYVEYYKEYDMGPHVHMHLAQLNEDAEMKGWGVWFVIRRSDGKMIGDAGFKGKPGSEKTVEVGYGILPEVQRQGYATEAVEALIGWAISSGQVAAVNAECYADNLASIKVLEKLGMKQVSAEEDILLWEKKLLG